MHLLIKKIKPSSMKLNLSKTEIKCIYSSFPFLTPLHDYENEIQCRLAKYTSFLICNLPLLFRKLREQVLFFCSQGSSLLESQRLLKHFSQQHLSQKQVHSFVLCYLTKPSMTSSVKLAT